MRKFRNFKNSTCKKVMNESVGGDLFETWEDYSIEIVTVVKFGVDIRGSDCVGCFRIKVRTA